MGKKSFSTSFISVTSKFVIGKDVSFTDIGNEAIILNLKDNNFYTLNETAAKIWKLLRKKKTLKEIADIFAQEYVSGKKRLLRSVKRQMKEFLASGLLEKEAGDY